jgi:hypothetical protein
MSNQTLKIPDAPDKTPNPTRRRTFVAHASTSAARHVQSSDAATCPPGWYPPALASPAGVSRGSAARLMTGVARGVSIQAVVDTA